MFWKIDSFRGWSFFGPASLRIIPPIIRTNLATDLSVSISPPNHHVSASEIQPSRLQNRNCWHHSMNQEQQKIHSCQMCKVLSFWKDLIFALLSIHGNTLVTRVCPTTELLEYVVELHCHEYISIFDVFCCFHVWLNWPIRCEYSRGVPRLMYSIQFFWVQILLLSKCMETPESTINSLLDHFSVP